MSSRVRYAVVTLSDRASAGTYVDAAGPRACVLVDDALPSERVRAVLLPDDRREIERALVRLADEERCDLVLTTGGTGLGPRDFTPEATRAVIDRELPGMAEAIRAAGCAHTPLAMLSRGVCGVRGRTLVVNLSGSPKAVAEQLAVVLPVVPHALAMLRGGDHGA